MLNLMLALTRLLLLVFSILSYRSLGKAAITSIPYVDKVLQRLNARA